MPLIADADTGYGNALNAYRTVQEYGRAGIAALHIEDQVWPKECCHMRGKRTIATEEMAEKIAGIRKMVEDPEQQERIRKMGFEIRYKNPQVYGDSWNEEGKRISELISSLDAQ